MTMDAINDVLFWICWFVLLWNGYYLLVNKGIPNIKTAPAIRKRIIEVLKEEVKKSGKKDFTIIDLGSGGGTFTRQIALSIPEAKVIGIEISKPAYWYSCFWRKIKKIKNLHYRNEDFYKTNIGEADVVVMFLLGSLMGYIRPKLENDLKDGTLVISNKFKINGDWVPLDEINVKTLAPHQKTFYLYRK